MLQATPTAWFSWNVRVEQAGRELAVLERSFFLDRGRFTAAGVEYRIARGGFRVWLLEIDGRTLARARGTGLMRVGFEVTAQDRVLTLRAARPLSRRFTLLHGDLEIGSMRATSLFRRSAQIDFPDELPLPLRLFLTFLVFTAWKRAQRSAAG